MASLNGTGNKWNATKEVISFLGAEAGSIILSIGAFTALPELLPGVMNASSEVVAKIIEPFQGAIEKGLKNCDSKHCQVDQNEDAKTRRKRYASYLSNLLISGGLGLGAEMLLRKALNSKYVLDVQHPANNLVVCGMDKAIHLGLIGVINTVGAKPADIAIDASSNVLQKTLNWPKERADRAADVTVRWEIANWVSALAVSGYMVWRQLSGRGRA